MRPIVRIVCSLPLLATLIAGTTAAASAATPQTANIECTSTVTLPAQDGFTVTLPATPSYSTDCFLVINDSGDGVAVLQAALKLCNGQSGLVVDGDFGPLTQAAVKAVQQAHHITADGGYGNQTRGVMLWPDNNSTRCTKPSHF